MDINSEKHDSHETEGSQEERQDAYEIIAI